MNKIIRKFLAVFILCVVTVYNKAGLVTGKSNALGAPEPETATQSVRLTWQRLDIPNPPPRIAFSLAFNSTDQKAYLFGGWNSTAGYLNDLWSFNGTEWTQLQPSRNPTERAGANLVYDQARQEMILFGGGNSSELFGNTWEFIPYDWAQQFPPTSPQPREGACMAYDAARNKTFLFGGEYPFNDDNYALNDTWTWDGASWQPQNPSAAPNARSGAAMVYDVARQNILLFSGGVGGGILDDTWVWDGTTWLEQHPLHSPAGRVDSSMAYDESRQQVILFGGSIATGSTDTWAWDGHDWTRLQTFQAPPEGIALYAQLVYLPSLHTMVLVGDYRQKDCSVDPCTFTEETQVWALESLTLSYLPMISR